MFGGSYCMLILTRRLNEAIKIGDDIEVMVTAITPGYIKLGVKAPSDVNVVRTELLLRN